MQWFMELKTVQKILSLVFVMSMFILGLGLLSYNQIEKANKDMESLYADRLMSIDYLNTCSRAADLNIASLYRLMTEKDKNEQKQIVKDIQKRAKKFVDALKTMEATELDATEKEDISKIKQTLVKYKATRAIIIKLALENRQKDAYSYFMENYAVLTHFTDNLEHLIKYEEKMAKETNTKNNIDGANQKIILLAAIFLALALGSAFGIYLANMISTRLGRVVKHLEELANGNLAVNDLKIYSSDEIGQLGVAMNKMTRTLQKLVKQVADSVQEITSGSEQMNIAAEQTAIGAQQVANNVTQLAYGANQVSTNIEEGAKNISHINKVIQAIHNEAKEVAALGNNTETSANSGKKEVDKAVLKIQSIRNSSANISTAISELGQLSSQIEQIVDLIKSIAGQTNLLALNAAIEAARAGEHGKGFAVVAEEVKKLAEQSGSATDKITTMIKEVQNKTNLAINNVNAGVKEVDEGVIVVNEAGATLNTIIEQVKLANTKIQLITKEISGAAANSDEIVAMIENISAVTEETAASAEEVSSITQEQTASLQEINASSHTLAKISEELQVQVSVFKV